MKCEDVQDWIWSGERNQELETHLQTCERCRSEYEEMKQLMSTIGGIQTPVPTRSLQPSRDIIRQTVRHNRRKRWMNGITIAASLALVIGAGFWTTLSLQSANQSTEPPKPSEPPAINEPIQQAELEVSLATDKYPEFTAAIRDRLLNVISKEEIVRIKILDYTPQLDASSSVVFGTAKLEIEANPKMAAGSKLVSIETARVRFNQENGKWVANLIDLEIAPKTPEDTVQKWADAIKARDGLLEYSTFHPDLKVQWYADRGGKWGIGVSSPWLDSYTIERVDKLPVADSKNAYRRVTFKLKTSGGDEGEEQVILTTQKDGDHYWITNQVILASDRDPYLSSTVTLPDQTVLKSDASPAAWQGLQLSLSSFHLNKQENGFDTMVAPILFVDNVPTSFSAIDIPNVSGARLFENDHLNKAPNAKGGEFYLVVERGDEMDGAMSYVHMLRVRYTGDQKTAQQQAIQLASTWKFAPQ